MQYYTTPHIRRLQRHTRLRIVALLAVFFVCACSSHATSPASPWARPARPIEAPTLPDLQWVPNGDGSCTATLDSDTLFDTGKATLTAEAMTIVEQLAKTVRSQSAYVQLVGHADGQGDHASNQMLSEHRANSIKQALIERGIAETAISTCGVGDTGAAPQQDDQSFRRVDALIAKSKPSSCPAR